MIIIGMGNPRELSSNSFWLMPGQTKASYSILYFVLFPVELLESQFRGLSDPDDYSNLVLSDPNGSRNVDAARRMEEKERIEWREREKVGSEDQMKAGRKDSWSNERGAFYVTG